MIKNMYSIQQNQGTLFFRASTSSSKVLKDKKIFQHSEKFQGNSVFQAKKVVRKSE